MWDEMIRLGDSIRDEPVLSDALAVVREVVDRSHQNLNCTLIMQSLDACLEQMELPIRERREDPRTSQEFSRSKFGPALPPRFLALGPSTSNCDLMGFSLPNLGVDGVFYNDGAGDIHFIDHLRNVFEWGGFPFCQWYSKQRWHHFLSARPDIEKVLPILNDGLLPL